MLTVDDIDWEGEVPLSSVMFHWRPVYPHGGDWEDTVRVLLECPGEHALVEILRGELRKNGRFNEPIYLSYSPREEDDGEVYEESWTVGNGTHRVVASYLEGVDTIHATRLNDDGKPEPEYLDLEMTLDISGASPTCEGDIESDELDFVMDYLRSFRLDDETWVECGTASGNSEGVSIFYYCPHEKRDALAAMVLDLCEEQHAKAVITSINIDPFKDEED